MNINTITQQDCLIGLRELPDCCIDCCVTSPPYFGLRDYGTKEQIGLESTPELFVAALVEVFKEVRRVLKNDGTLWCNLGDSYAAGKSGNSSFGDLSSTLNNGKKGVGNKTGELMKITQRKPSAGLKPKDLIGIPWMVAFALRSSGWYLRQDIIWHKPNPMPESVTDRCTKSHEYIFLLSKSAKYYYDYESIKTESKDFMNDIRRSEQQSWDNKSAPGNLKNGIRPKFIKLGEKSFSKGQENGKGIAPSGNGKNDYYKLKEGANKRSVWTVTTKPYNEAHFATFPEDLIVDMIKAGCPEGGIVLDPFMGAGTTAVVAKKLNRNYIAFELNPDYINIANKRLYSEIGMFL